MHVAFRNWIHSWPLTGQQDCWGHTHDADSWLDTETDFRRVLSSPGGLLCASSCLLTSSCFAEALCASRGRLCWCSTREMSVRRKLNAMPAVFEGKKVLLVDDSIVRGTTMSQIVEMVRRAGATKASPPSLLCPRMDHWNGLSAERADGISAACY